MVPFDLVVRNYRCFEDAEPLRLRIEPGRFIAFVGPNNSGKSAALRMFYELREVFGFFKPGHREIVLGSQPGQTTALGVAEATEILCDRNERPLTLEFRFPEQIRVRLTVERTGWWNYQVEHKDRRLEAKQFTKDQDGRFTFQQLGTVDLAPAFAAFRMLANALYVGPFRNAVNVGEGTYYDLSIGTAFVRDWNVWKNGNAKKFALATERVTDDIERIFRFQRLDINAAQDGKTLKLVVDGRPYGLNEMGAGIAQFIVVLATCAMRRPSIILIDEPELNLHPALQAEFVTALASYASEGVLFATHSLGLARTTAEQIYAFRRQDGRSACREIEALSNYAEFMGEMQFSAFQELGFEGILLVEGVTDVRLMHQFLRMYDLDHKYVVVPLGGTSLARGNVDYELAELKRITTKVRAIVDSERESESGAAVADRLKFAASCESLGFDVCLTRLRALDNYLTDAAIKSALGPKATALGPYESLKGSQNGWRKADNWRVAQYMTSADLDATDVGAFLRQL